MKTAKLVIGIISIVLFVVISFQSCATGLVSGIDQAIYGEESEMAGDTSAGGGMFVAFSMLIAGIVGLATRKSKGGGIAAGIFYILAAIIGFANLGTFGDLVVWAVLSLVFGIVFIVGSVRMKKEIKTATE